MRYKKLVDTIYDRLKDYSDENSIEYLSVARELCELIQETINKASNHPRWNEAMKIAYSDPKTNYTKGADHYHADYVNPYWAKSLTKTVVIGRHIFYK